MTHDKIYDILIVRGYTPAQSKILAPRLANLSQELQPLLEEWIISEKEQNIIIHDVDMLSLAKSSSLKSPAALLSMDWVIREPDKAIPTIKKGIR